MKIKINSIFGSLKFEGDFSNIKECVLAAIKSGANLRGANLCGADLCGADLCGADLCGADLCGANLCGADLCGANLCGANLCGADLCGADLCGANLCGANLRGANLRGANLRGANLCGVNLCGANLCGVKIKSARIFSGLYRYQIYALLTVKGQRFVKMGCLFKSLEEWGKVGILKSNESEFPDDGSRKSQERAEAFEFAKNAALKLE